MINILFLNRTNIIKNLKPADIADITGIETRIPETRKNSRYPHIKPGGWRIWALGIPAGGGYGLGEFRGYPYPRVYTR